MFGQDLRAPQSRKDAAQVDNAVSGPSGTDAVAVTVVASVIGCFLSFGWSSLAGKRRLAAFGRGLDALPEVGAAYVR
ncbi:hypothetical protein ACVIHI_008622 [Bradyrhizobium sp. USDA 4524]|nr:hypothetical protein [Bradyrhizobium sp. USDA 4538]MCP1907452.1 hypothetical protein [Bradyrhizobium sp. USDA 4537]MCP1985238.1 hypothetical protein [Bradyrhizobium sp. USDA 4539]